MTGNDVFVDSNIFISVMKGNTFLAKRLESFKSVYSSPVVTSELYFGAYRSINPHKHFEKITIVLNKTNLLAVDEETSKLFAKIKSELLAKGKPIPENDIWIAASAIQYQLPIYTQDSHFEEVSGLSVIS